MADFTFRTGRNSEQGLGLEQFFILSGPGGRRDAERQHQFLRGIGYCPS